MKSLVKKIGEIFDALEKERGEEFVLFALVLPEDAIAWDLLVAAKWIDKDKSSALRYIAQRIQGALTSQELRDLAGVLLFDTADFDDTISSLRSQKGWIENEADFYGRKIQKGYLFAAPLADLQVFANR